MTINLRSDKVPSRVVMRTLKLTSKTKRPSVELQFPFQVLGVGENVDDIVPRLGLVDGDFTKHLQFEGAPSEVPVVVTEVGEGTYEAAFTAGEAGSWSLHVLPTDTEEQFNGFDATLKAGGQVLEALAIVTYDETEAVMRVETWGVRNGRNVPLEELGSVQVDLYDHEDNLLFTLDSTTSEPNGRFTLEHDLAELDTENPYTMTVAIELVAGEVVETSHVLSTVEG
jgi:hypothetical protein